MGRRCNGVRLWRTPCRMLHFFPILIMAFIAANSCRKAHGQSTTFSFDTLSARNLTLLGDSFLQNGNLGLTRDTSVPASSVGRALYNIPVRFQDPSTNRSASFQTSFSFSVTNQNPTLAGDGLAFIIIPDNSTLGSSGGWLGLLNATDNGKISAHAIAVEFDTFLDVNFFDINDNHVGVDINNMRSVVAADAGSVQINLKSGNVITAWIDYNSSGRVLRVWMSYSGQKPQSPMLVANLSLSSFLNEFMYVGFSSSTGGSQDLHSVYTWSFSTSGLTSPVIPSSSSPAAQPASSPTAPPASPRQIATPSASAPGLSVATQKGKCRSPFCLGIGAFLGVSIGAAIVSAIVIVSVAWCAYSNWRKVLWGSFSSDSEDLVKRPRRFSYRELSVATKGFSASKVVGHGAFGNVYKGILSGSGRIVAVKRSMGNNQSKSEFLAELSIIGCLRHRNLVQLLGWCHEKGEILLVYDYMPQGSLDKLLFNKGATVLAWAHRHKILTGVAAALAYLHEECEQQVVHRDVKASNIMLDASFNARLGDFGLARLTDHNKSPDATLTAGTMGYLAPEYIHTGKASEKTDVFSYGAVVLEVCCGRRPLERDLSPKENVLVDWVWGLHRHGSLLEAADERLGGEFEKEEMDRLLRVGLLCSHPDPISRPTMRQVLQILTGEVALPPVPRFKPTPSFALLSLPLSLQDIISESGHSPSSSPSNSFS